MLGLIWDAALWLSCSIVGVAVVVLAWAWIGAAVRGSHARRASIEPIGFRSDILPTSMEPSEV